MLILQMRMSLRNFHDHKKGEEQHGDLIQAFWTFKFMPFPFNMLLPKVLYFLGISHILGTVSYGDNYSSF